jgi:hypothetical protein
VIQNLYIVGNGFDRHHGIPSSYWHFGQYFQRHDPDTFQRLERYFVFDDSFWNEFEERLASFDIDTLIEDAEQFLVGYGAEDWSDAYHHDYQWEIDQGLEAVTRTMRARFAEWIRQLPIPDISAVAAPLHGLDPSATFLNFNYTPSLQRLYGVADAHIVPIHGAAVQADAELILGHGWQRTEKDSRNYRVDPEREDVRVMQGNAQLEKYFSETFKPTTRVIADHRQFFDALGGVTKISVLGHSMALVDHPYLREILARIDTQTVQWRISYHGSPADIRAQVEALGIAPKCVIYDTLDRF